MATTTIVSTNTTWKPDDAKAMFGAAFVETVIYSMFYLAMHIKDHESDLLSRKRNLSKQVVDNFRGLSLEQGIR